jgi:mannitol 2-dehydrogenase
MVKLSTKTLPEISKVATVPGFDRSQLQPGIVHVGVGNFHRAHQAVYLNELLNLGGDPHGGFEGQGCARPMR